MLRWHYATFTEYPRDTTGARAFAFGGVGAFAEAVLVVCGASRERVRGLSAGGGARALRGRTPLT